MGDVHVGQQRVHATAVDLRASPLETAAGPVSVTASVGFTALRPTDKGIDDLLHRADLALYAAKRAGRDRQVCFVDPAGPTG